MSSFTRTQRQGILLLTGLLYAPLCASGDFDVFIDRDTFLAATAATVASAPYSAANRPPEPFVSGSISIDAIAPSTLHFGAWPVDFPDDNNIEMALNDAESLDLTHIHGLVTAMGIEFDDAGGTSPSTFSIAALKGDAVVASYQFLAPAEPIEGFIGIWSSIPFDRLSIRETPTANENKFFGTIFVSQVERPLSRQDQENPLDGRAGGRGIGCYDQISGDPDPDCTRFYWQDAHSFEVGIGGQLTAIRIPVRALDRPVTLPVTLEVLELTPEGLPDDNRSLGAVTLPVSSFRAFDFQDSSTWPQFILAPLNIRVSVGDRLAYRLFTRDTMGYIHNPETAEPEDQYPRGRGFRRNAATGEGWSELSTQQYLFQTLVAPEGLYFLGDFEQPADRHRTPVAVLTAFQ